MSNEANLPDVATAQQVVLEGICKRAFLGRLAELGHVPANETEAEALIQLGYKIAAADADPQLNKQAAQSQQPGPYAFASAQLDQFLGVKQAAAPNPSGLDDVSIAGAMELANDPEIFASALVLKAAQEQAQL